MAETIPEAKHKILMCFVCREESNVPLDQPISPSVVQCDNGCQSSMIHYECLAQSIKHKNHEKGFSFVRTTTTDVSNLCICPFHNGRFSDTLHATMSREISEPALALHVTTLTPYQCFIGFIFVYVMVLYMHLIDALAPTNARFIIVPLLGDDFVVQGIVSLGLLFFTLSIWSVCMLCLPKVPFRYLLGLIQNYAYAKIMFAVASYYITLNLSKASILDFTQTMFGYFVLLLLNGLFGMMLHNDEPNRELRKTSKTMVKELFAMNTVCLMKIWCHLMANSFSVAIWQPFEFLSLPLQSLTFGISTVYLITHQVTTTLRMLKSPDKTLHVSAIFYVWNMFQWPYYLWLAYSSSESGAFPNVNSLIVIPFILPYIERVFESMKQLHWLHSTKKRQSISFCYTDKTFMTPVTIEL